MIVATLNLKNMFGSGEWQHYSKTISYDEDFVAKRTKYLTKVIASLKADIIVLQEVGSPEVLGKITAALPRKYDMFVAEPDRRGIANGLLFGRNLSCSCESIRLVPSLPPLSIKDSKTDGAKGTQRRAYILAKTTYNKLPLYIIGVHFKSSNPTYLTDTAGHQQEPQSQVDVCDGYIRAELARLAEARALRSFVDELITSVPNIQLVIAGDYNDTELSPTVKAIRGDEAMFGGNLENVCERIPPPKRYSKLTLGVKRLIDHMLISNNISKNVASVRIMNKSLNDQDGIEPSKEAFIIESDHAPIVVKFK
ncbi:MAG: hypothetical protein HY974_02845 [Candidatus Kerfeldbacteria bacterium]|nr:hypothetical protein [Candidatus Kerfeldbacteria bacterium]